MSELSLYAEALSYPVPGRIEKWMAGLGRSAQSAGVAEFAAFVQALLPLSQGELEELYTRTLDLNPEIAPYLGYQMWGDSYKRGNLMAKLNKAMQEYQIDLGGELPDHLAPVLRYLDQAAEPLPDLVQVFELAVKKMIQKLEKQDPANPYLHMLRAVLVAGNWNG